MNVYIIHRLSTFNFLKRDGATATFERQGRPVELLDNYVLDRARLWRLESTPRLRRMGGQLNWQTSSASHWRVRLCDVFSAPGGVLEHDVSFEIVKRHKRASLGRLAELTETVQKHVPDTGDAPGTCATYSKRAVPK